MLRCRLSVSGDEFGVEVIRVAFVYACSLCQSYCSQQFFEFINQAKVRQTAAMLVNLFLAHSEDCHPLTTNNQRLSIFGGNLSPLCA